MSWQKIHIHHDKSWVEYQIKAVAKDLPQDKSDGVIKLFKSFSGLWLAVAQGETWRIPLGHIEGNTVDEIQDKAIEAAAAWRIAPCTH